MKTFLTALSPAAVALCVGLLLIHAASALRIASAVPHLRGVARVLQPVDVHAMRRRLDDRAPHSGDAARPPVIHQHSTAPSPSMRAVEHPRSVGFAWSPSMIHEAHAPLLPTVRPAWSVGDWHAGNHSRHSVPAPRTGIDP